VKYVITVWFPLTRRMRTLESESRPAAHRLLFALRAQGIWAVAVPARLEEQLETSLRKDKP
jgi:hypothetical protein